MITDREYTDVCLVGLGPAGIGFIDGFLKSGLTQKLICLDSGKSAGSRHCPVLKGKNCVFNNPCKISSGFGGASLMAGGKLSLLPAGQVIEEYFDDPIESLEAINASLKFYSSRLNLFGAQMEIGEVEEANKYYSSKGFDFKYYNSLLYRQKEFIQMHKELEHQLIASGLDVRFSTQVSSISKVDGKFLLTGSKGKKTFEIVADSLVLGIGKGGVDKLNLDGLGEDLNIYKEFNCLELGVRLEFPDKAFGQIDKFHNDLKLKSQSNGCKTFCVSKQGKVALYLRDGILFTEGYENINEPTKFTNLAVVKKLEPIEGNLLRWRSLTRALSQRKDQAPIRQAYHDFLEERPTVELSNEASISYYQSGNIGDYLQPEEYEDIKTFLQKFINSFIPEGFRKDCYLYFPESNYGGYKITPKIGSETIPGLYIIGEASGQFLGILQSHAIGRTCGIHLANELQ